MVDKEIGEEIKRARKSKKLTLRELAEKTGISHSYLSQLENGRGKNPSAAFLKAISDALDAPIIEIAIENVEKKISKCLYFITSSQKEISNDKKSYMHKHIYTLREKELETELVLLEKELRELVKAKSMVYIDEVKDVENLKAGLNLMKQAEDNYNNNIGTPIYLNENNEGNFYFFKDHEGVNKILDDDIQEKIKNIIKTLLG